MSKYPFASLISESLKGSAGRREGLATGAREVEEEEELEEAAGGTEGTTAGGAGTTPGAAPAEGGQPDKVRSEAKETERSPRVKERSGDTAGAGRDAPDAGT